MFVTSSSQDGDFGGIEGADALCSALAAQAELEVQNNRIEKVRAAMGAAMTPEFREKMGETFEVGHTDDILAILHHSGRTPRAE